MARWTETHADLVRISNAGKDIPISGIILMTLDDGSVIEGVIRRVNFGNNAGRGGWRYYGEYEIESIDGNRWVVDVLDIKSAQNIWQSRFADYEAAGLITIVR